MPVRKFAQPVSAQGDTPILGALWRGFPPPCYATQAALLYLGDVRACLRSLPARSVHCVITSPPYWGLRDYGTGTWEGGSAECDHLAPPAGGWQYKVTRGEEDVYDRGGNKGQQFKHTCGKCGANRIDKQIGAEPSPDCGTQGRAQCDKCFVCALVGVFREVYRVLRDDGTCWLNLGDSYTGAASGQNFTISSGSTASGRTEVTGGFGHIPRPAYKGLPSGNLVGVPWRVALALQADGWILRQDIIWAKPNPMPESVTNRCTKSHEYIFLLAKGEGYYYDATAIAENADEKSALRYKSPFCIETKETSGCGRPNLHANTAGMREWTGVRNKRSVWSVVTRGYAGAHFAVFPQELVTPCILAGTSEHGCCATCGKPWERVVSRQRAKSRVSGGGNCFGKQSEGTTAAGAQQEYNYQQVVSSETVGWRKLCGCATSEVVPAIVLDPFVGSGTTVATAILLGRAGVGIDLSETYLREHAIPRIEAALRGEKVTRPTVALAPGVAPAPRRLRGVPE